VLKGFRVRLFLERSAVNILRVLFLASCVLALLFVTPTADSDNLSNQKNFTNSIGMKLVRIEAGSFDQGFEGAPLPPGLLRFQQSERVKTFLENGNPDEHPRHRVTILRPFHMGAFEVTNREYEQFDPDHAQFRGWHGRSHRDTDPVILVSWEEARAFCRWLSEKEGQPYRLPTEAEWEYACRAGTETPFYPKETWLKAWLETPSNFSAPAARENPAREFPANAWGLHDMHGSVEEWCEDWYGPYSSAAQIDPVGRAGGQFKVTRGGSSEADNFYLRSANRGGTFRGDKSRILGFRVVLGESPRTAPLAVVKEGYQKDVSQTVPADIKVGPDPASPHFDIRTYVRIPEGQSGPLFYYHNHNPDIVECPNGDLLAIFFSTESEGDREMVYGASRLCRGSSSWDPSSLFWGPPDRKAEYSALWVDGQKLHHFSSVGAFRSRPGAVVLRTSEDNGVHWSQPRTIAARKEEQGVMESVIRMRYGTIAVPLDDHNVLLSYDDGATWSSPVQGDLKKNGIFGIHTPIVELQGGDLLAFGRNDNIDGRMPRSISSDVGQSWTHSASPFPPVGGGQRATMLRLQEGPIFFASFAKSLEMSNGEREKTPCSGLFAALSFDEGETWPVLQLISDGSGRDVFTRKNKYYKMTPTVSEKNGYLASCQSRDGILHVVSNRVEYAFNLKWLWSGYEAEAGKN